MNNTSRLKLIDEVYQTIPKIDCKKLCHECCGPVMMSRLEWKRIKDSTDEKLAPREDLVCPMLKNNLCSVYSIRPLICRLWGVVPEMKCPHGCTPERFLTEPEVQEIMVKVSKLGF